MSIRLVHSCINCEKNDKGYCTLHSTAVGAAYTCDSFVMKADLKNDPNCVTCSRYETSNCANPQKAAPGMLCNHWAPMATA